MVTFHVISRNIAPPLAGQNAVFLRIDHWNDYSFVTMFDVYAFDEQGVRHDLDQVKIGFKGQTTADPTHSKIASPFERLPENFFSAGMDVAYYKALANDFSEPFRAAFLTGLRDVVADPSILTWAAAEPVFKTSHLRGISMSALETQFPRVLAGGILSTDFEFRFTADPELRRAGFQLEFDIEADSTPRTNIHAIIGRNGVGKTSLLNAMVRSIMDPTVQNSRFEVPRPQHFGAKTFAPLGLNYFSSVISISFSAFDPFDPPAEQTDPSKGTCYFYIGLKSPSDGRGTRLKSLDDLYREFVEALGMCLSQTGKRIRWLSAIKMLESDDNFAEMNLGQLSDLPGEQRSDAIRSLQNRMSSGHWIVLLTITKLVARLEEKTLVLFDEPESHLHPPLLSALIRSLSELLQDRNAVAVIATHSPVVLQEVPKSCVWKIVRAGLASDASRPDDETFGENVGLLTRDVFGLEVSKSGFNALLHKAAAGASTYEEALDVFGQQLGFEGRAILRSIMHSGGKK